MTLAQEPIPLGRAAAGKIAQSVAAPLLAAAALSLAGVVAAANESTFRWPGPTLLLLVVSSLSLVASIQLHYHGRDYLYTRTDIEDWYGAEIKNQEAIFRALRTWQGDDYIKWNKFNNFMVHSFNAGTVILGLGIAVALFPPGTSTQFGWRVAACSLVLAATAVDTLWILLMYRHSGDLQRTRMGELQAIIKKTGETT